MPASDAVTFISTKGPYVLHSPQLARLEESLATGKEEQAADKGSHGEGASGIEIELQDARTSIDPSETESSQEKRFIPIDEVPEKTRSSPGRVEFSLSGAQESMRMMTEGGIELVEAHSEMKFPGHDPYPNPNP